MQTQPDVSVASAARSAGEASTSGAGLYKGPMDCLKRTLQKEGVSRTHSRFVLLWLIYLLNRETHHSVAMDVGSSAHLGCMQLDKVLPYDQAL